MKNSEKWNKRYLKLAKEISTWSIDPSTKIGAIAVGDSGQVLAQGYNGFPRKVLDSPTRYNTRELKYKFVVHAEMNVIFNASLNGVSLKDSTLFIYGLHPCHECAKGIIQSGIAKVVISDRSSPDRWKESFDIAKTMLDEAGVYLETMS